MSILSAFFAGFVFCWILGGYAAMFLLEKGGCDDFHV